MNETTKIELKFIDNKNHISFNLSQNTVFYGLNGHGKTRILKTIQLLSELGKTKNFKTTLEIIESLNLDYLRIDNVDHDGLFRSSNKIITDQENILIDKIKDNLSILNFLIDLLTSLGDKLNDFSDFIPPLFLNRFNNHIRFNIRENKSFIEILSNNPIQLRHWLQTTRKLINQLIQMDLYFEREISDFLQEIDKLTSHLLDNIFFDNAFYVQSSSTKLRDRLEKQKKNIIKYLGSLNVHYISTENIQLDNMTQKIKKDMNTYKDILFSSLFNISKEQENNIINNYELVYNTSFKLLYDLHSKIDILNNTLQKYCSIKLDIDALATLTFIKDKEQISYCKLSSGEQRIIYIFFNMIFFDADIYLIDEPELSLSIDYQNKIVTDLINLSNDKILMVATHAPFIFNDFKNTENTNIKEV